MTSRLSPMKQKRPLPPRRQPDQYDLADMYYHDDMRREDEAKAKNAKSPVPLEPEPVKFKIRYQGSPIEGSSYFSGWAHYKYHEGGTFTKPGWYTMNDYEEITVLKNTPHVLKEYLFTQGHPISAWKIGSTDWDKDGDIATSAVAFSTNVKLGGESRDEMVAQNRDGTIQNAFRHALLMAFTTIELDELTARNVGNAHESHSNRHFVFQEGHVFTKKWEADEWADLANNLLARKLASTWNNDEITRKDVAGILLDYFKDKGLYVVIGDQLAGYSAIIRKLTMDEYQRAKSNIELMDIYGFNEKDGDLYSPDSK